MTNKPAPSLPPPLPLPPLLPTLQIIKSKAVQLFVTFDWTLNIMSVKEVASGAQTTFTQAAAIGGSNSSSYQAKEVRGAPIVSLTNVAT